MIVQPAHCDGPYGVLIIFWAEGHPVLLGQLVTAADPATQVAC